MPEFECSRQIVLPAGPDRVWEAVATTEGNAAWLFPNEIAPDGAGAKGHLRRRGARRNPGAVRVGHARRL